MDRFKRILVDVPWLWVMVRIAVAGVFVLAGVSKLMDPRAFARVVYEYGLVPDVLLVPIAIGLPIVELLAGTGLAFNVRGCLEAIWGLLVLFIGVLGYAIYFNLDVDCGCFSAEELQAHHGVRAAFYRDLFMLAVITCLLVRRRLTHERPSLNDAVLLMP